MQRELGSLKNEVNKLKYKLEKERLFNIDDFKDNNADITFFTGFHWLDSGCHMRRSDSSLVYGTSSLGEPLLTAIPKQLMKDPIFWL